MLAVIDGGGGGVYYVKKFELSQLEIITQRIRSNRLHSTLAAIDDPLTYHFGKFALSQ